MTALPADVNRAIRPARVVTRSDAAIRALFPASRDGLLDPEPGFFESADDATTVLALKASLTGGIRRRYRVDISGEADIDPLAAVPSFRLVDSDLDADLPVMLARVEIDLEHETTAMEVIG